MTKAVHAIYIAILAAIVVTALIIQAISGISYYLLPVEERFYHEGHDLLKPSGLTGHGLGIAGSLAMIAGVSLYMARKRWGVMARLGRIKHWLEFHIFLCTLGPILVLFHTAFKFGGLVAVSFWSMVAVFLSGIAGRFIYLQIPRTIEGRELGLGEVSELQETLAREIGNLVPVDEATLQDPVKVRAFLREAAIDPALKKKVLGLARRSHALKKKIGRLEKMKELFRYWHVAHLPFAIIMLVIMLVHVTVTILFGYRWLF